MSSADFDPQIPLGAVLTNKEVAAAFKCSNNGGMRRSHSTNTLVITTSPAAMYADHWADGMLHYTGMGQTSHQTIDRTQNRTLAESDSNGVAVHLFEVLADNEYTYRGRVGLGGKPYQERQLDKNGDERLVWMFPLRLLAGGDLPTVPQAVLERAEGQRAREAQRLSDEEVRRRAALAPRHPSQRTVTSTSYARDPHVAEAAKRRANGTCQLCEKPAPFSNRKGVPFLETHHVIWLSKGGEDSIANTVALCPNCHRRVHQLAAPNDIRGLRQQAAIE